MRSICAAACAVFVLWESAASAEPSSSAVRDAQTRLAEARKLADQGRYEDALVKLQQACAVVPAIGCIRSLGSVELTTHRYAQAYEHLSEAKRRPEFATLPAETRRVVEDDWQKAYDHTAHLEIAARANTPLYVDGAFVGTAPAIDALAVTVTPGMHLVEARASDGTRTMESTAREGQVSRIEFKEEPAQPTGPVPAPSSGSSSSATSSPPSPSGSEPAPGPTTGDSLAPATPPFWNGRTTAAAVLGGVGLVGLAVGAGFAVASNNNDVASTRAGLSPGQCISQANAGCSAYHDAISSQQRDFTISVTSYAVGGVAILGAAAVLFWPRSHATSAMPWVQPTVGPGTASVEVGVAF